MSQPNRPIIIGITGYPGAGKDTFAGFLAQDLKNHDNKTITVSSGDLVRKYTSDNNLGDSGDRKVLQDVASKVMADRGYTVWLEEALKTAGDADALVYPGLRHPDEVEFVHNHGGLIIGLGVPIEMRFARAQNRDRDGDDIDFETFKRNDEQEANGKGQQVKTVMKMVDCKVINDGTLDQLDAVADTIAAALPDNLAKRYNASEQEA